MVILRLNQNDFFLKPKSIYKYVDGKKEYLAKAFLKKEFLTRGLVGEVLLPNGSKIIMSNYCMNKKILVEFNDGSVSSIYLDKYNGGCLHEDKDLKVYMPKFVNVSREGKDVEKITVDYKGDKFEEAQLLGLLICSHYFDYIFTMNHM